MSSTTQLQAVQQVLADGQWHTPWEVCAAATQRFNKQMSDSAVTARIRDLRKRKHGGFTVEVKRVGSKGSKACAYRLVNRQGVVG